MNGKTNLVTLGVGLGIEIGAGFGIFTALIAGIDVVVGIGSGLLIALV